MTQTYSYEVNFLQFPDLIFLNLKNTYINCIFIEIKIIHIKIQEKLQHSFLPITHSPHKMNNIFCNMCQCFIF
jgi:hypothetical protein